MKKKWVYPFQYSKHCTEASSILNILGDNLMTNGFDINLITGKAKDIAHNVDNKNVKDGKLSGQEISVFLAECKQDGIEIEKEPWYQKFRDFLTQSWSAFKPEGQVAERDATYVAPKPNTIPIAETTPPPKKTKETSTSI